MSTLKKAQKIFQHQPEEWLAYIYGQQLEALPHLLDKKPRITGLPARILMFAYYMLRNMGSGKHPELTRNAGYLFYAGTINQLNSLDSTLEALNTSRQPLIAIAPRVHLKETRSHAQYAPTAFSISDCLNAAWLFMTRGPSLYRRLKEHHPKAITSYFDKFCKAYIYIPYFYRVLSEVRPCCVIMANDHNVPNRCLMAVSAIMGIPTAYLQHASVSERFPALRFNYAFLDGQSALDTYRLCERNHPPDCSLLPKPEVVLSGQKKTLYHGPKNHQTAVVGLALNSLDDANASIELAESLANSGLQILLRWHPAQAPDSVAKFKQRLSHRDNIDLSDPKTEPTGRFLERLSHVIAGNSSIHLEAALSNVIPVYYEIASASTPDYYGYVSHGLALKAECVTELTTLIETTLKSGHPDTSSVQYYSATYGTDWEGKEGRLVADKLISKKLLSSSLNE